MDKTTKLLEKLMTMAAFHKLNHQAQFNESGNVKELRISDYRFCWAFERLGPATIRNNGIELSLNIKEDIALLKNNITTIFSSHNIKEIIWKR